MIYRSLKTKKLIIFLAFGVAVFSAVLGIFIIRNSSAANPNLTGDVDSNNVVDFTDLSILLTNYGTTNSTADLNADSKIDIFDLSILLSNYGKTYTPSSIKPVGISGNWTIKFQDEFDGTTLDLNKWSNCWFPPTCGTMNNVSTSSSNVTVGGGNLTLNLSSPTVGALISSNPSGGANPGFAFQYGVAEARIYFPGDGTNCYNWPAWWSNGQNWPQNGENDIAEVLGGSMTVNYHSASGSHNQGSVPGYWCGGYHTYSINRQPDRSDVYFDGVKVKSYATDDAGALQYLILNIGKSSTYTMIGVNGQVKVDYVRVWQ